MPVHGLIVWCLLVGAVESRTGCPVIVQVHVGSARVSKEDTHAAWVAQHELGHITRGWPWDVLEFPSRMLWRRASHCMLEVEGGEVPWNALLGIRNRLVCGVVQRTRSAQYISDLLQEG